MNLKFDRVNLSLFSPSIGLPLNNHWNVGRGNPLAEHTREIVSWSTNTTSAGGWLSIWTGTKETAIDVIMELVLKEI